MSPPPLISKSYWNYNLNPKNNISWPWSTKMCLKVRTNQSSVQWHLFFRDKRVFNLINTIHVILPYKLFWQNVSYLIDLTGKTLQLIQWVQQWQVWPNLQYKIFAVKISAKQCHISQLYQMFMTLRSYSEVLYVVELKGRKLQRQRLCFNMCKCHTTGYL